jgi:photosystem II stability/assembly factor-like uncharacterized protein
MCRALSVGLLMIEKPPIRSLLALVLFVGVACSAAQPPTSSGPTHAAPALSPSTVIPSTTIPASADTPTVELTSTSPVTTSTLVPLRLPTDQPVTAIPSITTASYGPASLTRAARTVDAMIYWALDRGPEQSPEQDKLRVYLFGVGDTNGSAKLLALDGSVVGEAAVMGSGIFSTDSCVSRVASKQSGVLPIGVIRMTDAARAAFLANPNAYRAEVDLGMMRSGARGIIARLVDSGCRPLPLSMSPTSSPAASSRPLVVMPTNAEVAIASNKVVWVRIGGVTGALLFRSEDQGATWQQRSLPPDARILGGLTFVDANHGWLLLASPPGTQCTAQSVQVWRTSDGAASWQNLGATGIHSSQCKQDLSFVDAQHGFLSAWDQTNRPTIYRTDDGGASWSPSAALPDPPGETTWSGGFTLHPRPVQRFGADLLVSAAGWQHLYIYKSTDGGANWVYLTMVTGATDVDEVSFLDTHNWWVSGPGLGPNYLYTSDAGASYGAAPGAPLSAAPIAPVFTFVDRNVGFATVRGQIWKTTDGGSHWTTVPTPGT